MVSPTAWEAHHSYPNLCINCYSNWPERVGFSLSNPPLKVARESREGLNRTCVLTPLLVQVSSTESAPEWYFAITPRTVPRWATITPQYRILSTLTTPSYNRLERAKMFKAVWIYVATEIPLSFLASAASKPPSLDIGNIVNPLTSYSKWDNLGILLFYVSKRTTVGHTPFHHAMYRRTFKDYDCIMYEIVGFAGVLSCVHDHTCRSQEEKECLLQQ